MVGFAGKLTVLIHGLVPLDVAMPPVGKTAIPVVQASKQTPVVPASKQRVSSGPANDPAELFLRLDRERANKFQGNIPFGNQRRNTFHVVVAGSLGIGFGMMYLAPIALELAATGASAAGAAPAAQTLQSGFRLSRILPGGHGTLESNWYRLWHLLAHAEGLAPAGKSYFFPVRACTSSLKKLKRLCRFCRETGTLRGL